MNTYLANKVVWITGASSGIGEEMVRQASASGAQVILSARKTAALNEIRNSLSDPDRHMVLELDLEQSGNFAVFAAQVVERYGRIDVLINNGGLSQRSKASETGLEVDRRIMEINYFGNIALTKAVLPYMTAQKSGHIIVISSISGKFGFFLRSAYSASKHALHGFYESLLLEEESNGIKVTIACPGKINTPISMNALTGEGTSHGVMDHNQETGMSAEECVKQLFQAASSNKKEVLIGNKEILAVKIKRLFPSLFWKIIRKQSAT
ncbi:MAG: SDR family oxidoreductase [Flavobacteriales bacterium]